MHAKRHHDEQKTNKCHRDYRLCCARDSHESRKTARPKLACDNHTAVPASGLIGERPRVRSRIRVTEPKSPFESDQTFIPREASEISIGLGVHEYTSISNNLLTTSDCLHQRVYRALAYQYRPFTLYFGSLCLLSSAYQLAYIPS